MKIGTITFHCAYNFGSALQTYALRKYLTDLGHDVHVIDYRSEDFRNYWIFRNTVSNRLPWICCSFRAIYADAAVSRLFGTGILI